MWTGFFRINDNGDTLVPWGKGYARDGWSDKLPVCHFKITRYRNNFQDTANGGGKATSMKNGAQKLNTEPKQYMDIGKFPQEASFSGCLKNSGRYTIISEMTTSCSEN